MRIAQIAPLMERVPPEGYGGTERVVSYLTETLVARGHDVTLFASADSQTAARLVPGTARALRTHRVHDPLAHHLAMLERVFSDPSRFDVMHFHTDYLHFPLARRTDVPSLTTLHGRLDLPDLPTIHAAYAGLPLVSVSNAQREPLPWVHWIATVPHGLPPELHRFRPRHEGYLAFVGRFSPEKRVDRAIEIARRAGLPLRIAAKLDPADEAYFDAEVRALLDQPHVDYLGELGGADKAALMAGALALLFPIDWPEPFGLVMIEAMACGTPVIAWRRGSVPEVIDEGVTGCIVEDLDDGVEAVARAGLLDRARVRATFEARFTVERMASDYEALYARLVAGEQAEAQPGGVR